MKTKKKLVSVVLAAAIAAAASVPAWATESFDLSVFQGIEGITAEQQSVKVDDTMVSGAIVWPTSYLQTANDEQPVGTVRVYPMVESLQDGDYMAFIFCCYPEEGTSPLFYEAELDIAGVTHTLETAPSMMDLALSEGARSSVTSPLTRDSLTMLQSLAEHRDEEIRGRLRGMPDIRQMYTTGSKEDVVMEFVLTQEDKDTLIDFYNRFGMAGGLREDNLRAIFGEE